MNRAEFFVYIEKYNKSDKYVLFDFVDSNEFFVFSSLYISNYDWEHLPTMIELLNYNQKPLQEGVNYSISLNSLLSIQNQIAVVEDSLLIGFRIVLTLENTIIFGKAKSFSDDDRFFRHMEDYSSFDLPKTNYRQYSVDKIIIRNVGQGSWNELESKGLKTLVFDFGTTYTTKKVDVYKLLGNRDIEYQKSSPTLILSHWDVDHYHFLLAFSNETIKSFPIFIYRSSIPNLTARKALGRFRILNKKALFALQANNPHPKKSSTLLQKLPFYGRSDLLLFNGYRNRSRNKSGIGLVLRKINISVIFSGDYDYLQISNYILPELNYVCKHYLIVPHHGGNAGKFIYDSPPKPILTEAIISVGPNIYNHPISKNVLELKKKGFKILRTDYLNNDYLINI